MMLTPFALGGCDALPVLGEETSDAPTNNETPPETDDDEPQMRAVNAMPVTAASIAPDGEFTPVDLHVDAPAPIEDVDVTIGAPGLWPPERTTVGGDASIVLPVVRAETFGGRRLTHYEIRAHGEYEGKTYGYWGEIDYGDEATARTIRLKPAGPLQVRVLGETGEAMSGASVRLSRGLVGLVNVAGQTGLDGRTRFVGIPEGDYRVTVEADGYVRHVGHVLRTSKSAETIDVELERGATVRGYVRDAAGQPVSGAEVSIYPESPFAGAAVDTSFLADLGVWSQVVTTDFDGHFVARGVGAEAVRVGAVAPGYAPALSDLIRFGESGAAHVDLVLQDGRGLRVNVLDDGGEPVPGATVRWESLEYDAGRSTSTDESGSAAFAAVPADAFVQATLGSWTSRRRNVPALEKGTTTTMELTLRKPVVRHVINVRLDGPDGVFVDKAVLEMNTGEVCPGEQTDEDRWRFEGCEPGEGVLRIRTKARGSHRFQRAFDETNELDLPDLIKAEVAIEGLHGREWRDATVGWRWPAVDFRSAEFAEERTSTMRIWRRMLLPGRYELSFEHSATGTQRFALDLRSEKTTFAWQLERRTTVPIYVTDAEGTPVDDALVQIWDDGELLREGYSRGANPLTMRLTPPVHAHIFAIDGRRGEAVRPLTIESGEELGDVILQLDAPLFSTPLPPGKLDERDEIEAVLGVPLVGDGDMWLIDATDSTSPAVKAGIDRGDRLLWVREGHDGHRVAVERGPDIVEVSIPR
jgi:hypothetical protein